MTHPKEDQLESAVESGDVESQLKRITEHLQFLEKKIDQLLENSKNQHRPFNTGPKPYRQPLHYAPRQGQGYDYRGGSGSYDNRRGQGGHQHGGGFHKKFSSHRPHSHHQGLRP